MQRPELLSAGSWIPLRPPLCVNFIVCAFFFCLSVLKQSIFFHGLSQFSSSLRIPIVLLWPMHIFQQVESGAATETPHCEAFSNVKDYQKL